MIHVPFSCYSFDKKKQLDKHLYTNFSVVIYFIKVEAFSNTTIAIESLTKKARNDFNIICR